MKHTIFIDNSLNGWEYGMLRSFERAIAEETGADASVIPAHSVSSKITEHLSYGMKRSKYRKFVPKNAWAPVADVAWYILMGPENYRLDLYEGWKTSTGKKILYLYDTMPSQYPVIKQICDKDDWDVLITSFNDAVEDLQKLTGKKWHCIEQAADDKIFKAAPFNERVIHFSSYGRRYPLLHEVIMDFCSANGLYYDYTTHDAKHPTAPSPELYKQYAWHVSHSMFTFSWPVELTNPARAGHLRPITCRWFEALAAGTPILGRKPANQAFDNLLHSELVIDIDPTADKKTLVKQIEAAWNSREHYFNIAQTARQASWSTNSWNERVKRILSLI